MNFPDLQKSQIKCLIGVYIFKKENAEIILHYCFTVIEISPIKIYKLQLFHLAPGGLKGTLCFFLTQHGMSSLSLPTKLLHLFQGPFQKLFSMGLSPQYKSELITSSYGLSKHFEPLNGNYFTLPCTIYMFKYVCLTRLQAP